MRKASTETEPLRPKSLTIAELDASIEHLKEAYYLYLSGEEVDAEIGARKRLNRLPGEEVAAWMKIPEKDLPDELVDYYGILMDFERRMDMQGALWRNHGCGQDPDCGHPILISLCQRYGFWFDCFGSTIPEWVEEVLSHLYKLRAAAEEDAKPAHKRVKYGRSLDSPGPNSK